MCVYNVNTGWDIYVILPLEPDVFYVIFLKMWSINEMIGTTLCQILLETTSPFVKMFSTVKFLLFVDYFFN